MSFELSALTEPLKIGDVANNNYFEIEENGFPVAKGDANAFRDEYPSAPWTAAGGAAAPDQTDHTIGGVLRRVWTFDGNATEERLSSSFEIPHDYYYGKPIEIHVHFRPSTTALGTVKWFFDYEKSAVNLTGAVSPVLPVAKTTMSALCTIAAAGQYAHYILSLGELPDTDYILGQKISFNIRRTPSQDTYPDDVILEQVAMHIPLDTNGSRQRYQK